MILRLFSTLDLGSVFLIMSVVALRRSGAFTSAPTSIAVNVGILYGEIVNDLGLRELSRLWDNFGIRGHSGFPYLFIADGNFWCHGNALSSSLTNSANL